MQKNKTGYHLERYCEVMNTKSRIFNRKRLESNAPHLMDQRVNKPSIPA